MGQLHGRRSEHRADKRTDRRKEYQRTLLAQEAARLICDHGIKDFRTAKSKAACSLGLSEYGALPSNLEIEAALAERNRIFSAGHHAELLQKLRDVAISVMYELQPFKPCLVGSVLSGNVTEHSNINMHVFADSSESVSMRLDACGIYYQLRQRKHSIRRGLPEEFPGYDFFANDFTVEATVFPERRKGHAPLSPVDGKPMRRARLRDVELLVNA
jgi:hypothetical protein